MDFGMPYLLECGGIEPCAEACARLGLRFLELNMSFPDCTLARLDPVRLRALGERLGIYFTIHMDELLRPCAYDERIGEAYLEHTARAIALAAEAGIPALNFHWERGVYVTLPDRVTYIDERYPEAYRARTLRFRETCARASAGRVALNIENTDGWLPFQREAILTLLEDPTFGLTLDIGHDAVAGGVDLPFYLARLDRLRHMHAHDAVGKRCHLPFGEGELDLRARLDLARSSGARVVLEVKTLEALRRTVEHPLVKSCL